MTDRYFALTVILEKDMRSDDAKSLIEAIKMLKGVLKVKPSVSDITTFMAEERAIHDLKMKLWKTLFPEFKE